ncbi:MAG: hypothetical protein ACRDPR_05640 [Nocardioidaceae bacterium]
MTTWDPGGGREVLSQGDGAPHRSAARVWGTAAACLALGALAGGQIDDALDDRRAAQELAAAPPVLSAGVVQENPRPVGDLRLAVPLFNGGSAAVTVDSVAAAGWATRDGRFRAVAIPPDSWLMVPMLARVECAEVGASAPQRLTVVSRTAHGTFEQSLPMPAAAPVLVDERARLCLDPVGSVPTADDLVGSWLVEEAGSAVGTVVRLREDGTFAIDPDVSRFGTDLNALGSFLGAFPGTSTRSGATLRLTAEAGHDCRPGDRTRWGLTLLEDGRLHIRHRPDRERWCGIEGGEVWVARRLP